MDSWEEIFQERFQSLPLLTKTFSEIDRHDITAYYEQKTSEWHLIVMVIAILNNIFDN